MNSAFYFYGNDQTECPLPCTEMASPCNLHSSGFRCQDHLPHRQNFISGSFFCPSPSFFITWTFLFFFSPSSPSSSLGWLSSSSCLPSAPPLIPHSLFRLCYPSCAFLFVSQGAHPCPVYLDEASPPGQKFCPHRPLAAPLLVFARFQISGTNHQAVWFLNTHCLQILPSPQSR